MSASPAMRSMRSGGVGVGPGGVVDIDRRVFLDPTAGVGRGQGHLAHRDPDVRPRPLDIDLVGLREGLGDRVGELIRAADEVGGNGAHLVASA